MSRFIAFWSPSGAGASTTLLNTAVALGARGLRVGVLDLNLTTPSLGLYADLLPHDAPGDLCLSRLMPALSGGRLTYDMIERLMVPGPGFFLQPGVLDPIAASRLSEGDLTQVVRLVMGRFDMVLADLTPALESIACFPLLEMADLICLIVGPSIASRFQTRRFALPLLGMGLSAKTALLLNQAGGISEDRVTEDIGLQVRASIPHLKVMEGLIEAGHIACDLQSLLPVATRYRQAIDRLANLIATGV